MPHRLTRRTLLASAGAALLPAELATPAGLSPGFAAAAYAGVRVVRRVPGEPGAGPEEIVLPDGYSLVAGSQYEALSRAEWLRFVTGPASSAGIPVSVRWDGELIEAVITGERRLDFGRDRSDPFRIGFTLPVTRSSPGADSPTVQVWSHLSAPSTGLYWHIEHNDANRAAGYWASHAWPENEAAGVITYMSAAREVLEDAGLVAEARRRGHFFALMGFETNNPMHQDNPPHWHLSYYPGPTMSAAKATVPHFWVDADALIFYNGQDVQGSGRAKYYVGDHAPIFDAEGGLVLTTTIRSDGGLDLDPPEGAQYSILPSGLILRGGEPWRRVGTADRVRTGEMDIQVDDELRHYRYDPLTGVLTA